MTYHNSPFALSITGVNKTAGKKAVRWLVRRNLLAWYDEKSQELRAFEFKYGADWTYAKLREAWEAVR